MNNRMTRVEKKEFLKKSAQDALRGSGRFVFQNRLSTDFTMPKAHFGKKTMVHAGEKFEGDSYFMQFVKTGELRLVSIIEPENLTNSIAAGNHAHNQSINPTPAAPAAVSIVSQENPVASFKIVAKSEVKFIPNEETVLTEAVKTENTEEVNVGVQKLILDIPDRVTAQGKVENVMVDPKKKLNEDGAFQIQKDVLLVEGPIDGIDIIG